MVGVWTKEINIGNEFGLFSITTVKKYMLRSFPFIQYSVFILIRKWILSAINEESTTVDTEIKLNSVSQPLSQLTAQTLIT